MNIQKVHAYANQALNEIAADPKAALVRPEYTDDIAAAMEDPSHRASPPGIAPFHP